MNWKSPSLKILNLTDTEKEVLTLLKEPRSIQELANLSPVPRTSLAYTVNKLVERTFVEKILIGKRNKYYSIPAERLQVMLEDASPRLGAKKQGTRIQNYTGIDTIYRIQAEMLSTVRNERVRAIQPNKSWTGLHAKVAPERVIHINNIIRNNNLIMDGIIERNAYTLFKQNNLNNPKWNRLAKSFGDRMADYIYAPHNYLTDQVEMWLVRNTILFIDWREEIAIKITDKHMSHFMQDMFTIVKETGARIDHNQAIRRVLK